MTDEFGCQLFVICARQAPIGVVFRRGPADWVQLIKWQIKTDEFEEGEWFHGRIYERRSDLSPDGTKLLYFAAQFQETPYDPSYGSAWTAVSKPPFFSPIALWPKGDCQAGGGLFHDDRAIWLNHRPERALPHAKHAPPERIHMNSNQWATGEDYPLYAKRLERDGWHYVQFGDFRMRDGAWVAEREEICTKLDHTRRFQLKMTLRRFEVAGSYHYTYTVRDQVTGDESDLDADNFADWDTRGRLIYVNNGKIFGGQVLAQARFDFDQLADFSANKPAEIAVPPEAVLW